MLEATTFLLLLGFVSSVGLAIASRIFHIEEDPRIQRVVDRLPGANCGGCGYAGCGSAAEAIVKGEAPCNICVVGGIDVAQAIGEVLGRAVAMREPQLAWTSCTFGTGEADPIFRYNGATDCRAAVELYGGSKLCPIGCIGLGTCVKVCQFDAVHMSEENLPVFDPHKCVACGACVRACPKNIISLTSSTTRIVGEYTTDECTAPCQRACPTGVDVPAYIRAIRRGDYKDGLRIVKERCPLPLTIGRICPAPCEIACRRNLVDEGIAINPLKRFLADHAMAAGEQINPYKAPDSGKRTAVIGGGVEGLTAAYYLARLGHGPTIFEAKPELGGILRYVISRDRLPKDVLDYDIEGVLAMGIEARTGVTLGRDVTLGGLLTEGYDVVLLTAGGYDSRQILNPDSGASTPAPGMHLMLDALARAAAGEALEVGVHVLIVGGEGKALELARHCLASGAQDVQIVSALPVDRLPKDLREPEALAGEGIRLRTETAVVSLGGEGDALQRATLAPAGQATTASTQRETISASTLFVGAGRLPELAFARICADDDKRLLWQTIELFRTFPDGDDFGLFTAPERGRTSDSTAVVKAMLSGRRIGRGLGQYFAGVAVEAVANLAAEAKAVLDVHEVHSVHAAERSGPPLPAAEAGTENDWLREGELPGIDEATARKEADRCLACGLICYVKAAS